jgi:serine/threonine-protein kinase
VVHRDLKPGNVMLAKPGAKLLDFGLAKLRDEKPVPSETESPTIQKPLTAQGTLLGTVQYMAPEQLEGKDADARTDIFAFGAVLYEMLTGKKAFEGESQASLIVAIMEREPPSITELQPVSPKALARLVTTCLAKDPDERWQASGDVRRELQWIAGEGAQIREGPASRPPRRLHLSVVGALIAFLAAGLAWFSKPDGSDARQETTRFVVPLSPEQELLSARSPAVAISSDGRHLVYAARVDGLSRLYLRPLDGFESRPIPGTEDARSPFFSPDDQWIGFFTADRLKKVSRDGGTPITVCEVLGEGQGSWSRDGNIIFAYTRNRLSGLLQVSANGGAPVALTSTNGEQYHRAPHIVPSAKSALFSSLSPGGNRLRVLSLEDRTIQDLPLGGAVAVSPTYVPTGHLLYGEAGDRLMAVPFDVSRLELQGSPLPVIENISCDLSVGMAHFSVSRNGTLAYVPRESDNHLMWVDRRGLATPIEPTRRVHLAPRLSPDGRRLAVAVVDESVGRRVIWVRDLLRGAMTRLTFAEGQATDPLWSPDGKQLAYAFAPEGSSWNIFLKSADGSGDAVLLYSSKHGMFPTSFSQNGRLLFFRQVDATSADTSADIGVIHLDEGNAPEIILGTKFEEIQSMLSPDGRWLAYTSNETGRKEVYVASFPDIDRKWQVSSDSGAEPLWAPQRNELYFRTWDRVMVVSFSTEPDFEPSKPSVLFEGRYAVDPFNADAHNWAISPDGERFLMISEQSPHQINVVLNWFQELKRLVPKD